MRTKLTVFLIVAVLVAATGYIGLVRATPSAGFTASTIAVGRFGDIEVANHAFFPRTTDLHSRRDRTLWLSFQKTKGPSDLYVQSNVWAPGGTTGWHTHPGHSLIIVTAGTVTAYEGDDPSCRPHVYTVGQGFVDEGGDHVHLIRNEGAAEARTVAVQLVQAGATRRIDMPASAHCSF
jgi:quercetin dioxygenase-like cupin family protein